MSSPEFKFSDAALQEYRDILGHYPTRQAALLPTLWIAQREFGWLPDAVQDYVASLMELPPAHVRAVVSFYTMFHRKPVGRFLLDVCTNLSCRLRGADQIVDCLSRKLGVRLGETTPDGKFTLASVECLASCGTAPMLQLNQAEFYENLTEASTLKLIDELASRDV
ncbi:MAG: NAD(P)H-dependent oxidoreductase subunit E [Candidatus Binatus sp.]|uniref:NADH-quinone oxidoreductase subunit NuoE family protein n=1 Tax=Candidatus Binatus sp. TaxID=2811406 RepID=UPI002716B2A3|nr:NAD(P)H-dependent oxidoreductase subunit E [Candidatus Binatus sp.]MDO8431679.1 NAD(P)H-dependent oxidoreductase subunit E [Candidatus Binatus sp.]